MIACSPRFQFFASEVSKGAAGPGPVLLTILGLDNSEHTSKFALSFFLTTLIMKIAVTGCNGSVGRHVVLRVLKEGHTAVGVDHVASQDTGFYNNPAFSFHQVDLRDFDAALQIFEGCDAIIQLAAFAQPMDYMVKVHNDNVVITWNVLRAAAELAIDRVALASSVNVLRGVYSTEPIFHYFPIDENHPCEPDEPYGLSKLIAETQADTIVRRYTSMRVASIRIHWFVPTRTRAYRKDYFRARGDLWGYVQMDAAADAFLRAVTVEKDFSLPHLKLAADEEWLELKGEYFPDVPIKPGWVESGAKGFYDCSKAERLLGWVHTDYT
ncbi:NAD(P)-binding protein [Suillus paluster]|uniref:NAD(P)-binding protein n=1 Tax=Suillus paluster TaxID=48578 RepID=UPI001B868DE1|nr:NAD(P)-binding protein [Suillus paluster]KAG1747052.1 NAD(P)-binding protein [Suillus paluster]